jgi:hypothetical protein
MSDQDNLRRDQMGNWTGLPTMLTVLTQKPASIFEQRVGRPGLMSITERCHILCMGTTFDLETLIRELKREAARQGCAISELKIPGWRKPSSEEMGALRRRRVSADIAKKVGDARRTYEARLRSGWDSYRGAIEAASHGNVARLVEIETAPHGDVARLVDCLRARKAPADGDRQDLADFIAEKMRRRLWPPELVRAVGTVAPSEDDFDLLADLVEVIGRRRGGVRDQPVHRAARLAEVLLSLWGRRVPDLIRTAVIAYACQVEGDDAGVAIEPERVRDLLNRPRARRHY